MAEGLNKPFTAAKGFKRLTIKGSKWKLICSLKTDKECFQKVHTYVVIKKILVFTKIFNNGFTVVNH